MNQIDCLQFLEPQNENEIVTNAERGYQVCGVPNRMKKPCQRVGLCPFHGTRTSLSKIVETDIPYRAKRGRKRAEEQDESFILSKRKGKKGKRTNHYIDARSVVFQNQAVLCQLGACCPSRPVLNPIWKEEPNFGSFGDSNPSSPSNSSDASPPSSYISHSVPSSSIPVLYDAKEEKKEVLNASNQQSWEEILESIGEDILDFPEFENTGDSGLLIDFKELNAMFTFD